MSIALVVICKNEAHVIARLLESVKGKVSEVYLFDNGSTDGTRAAAEQAWPGLVWKSVPWVNFAHNRSEALREARNIAPAHITHLLMVDADDVIEGDFLAPGPNTSYDLEVRHGNITHFRPHLFSVRHPWYFEGAVHEAAVCAVAGSHRGRLSGVVYRVVGGGWRSARGAQKFSDDANLLLAEYQKDPEKVSPRTVFYLAQSYRDAGLRGQAVHWYRKRAGMGGWDQEKFMAAFEAAKLEPSYVAYLSAWEMLPERIEPLVYASRLARFNGHHNQALMFAEQAHQIAADRGFQAPSGLFLEADCWEWAATDERSIGAYWVAVATKDVDLMRVSVSDCKWLLNGVFGQLPPDQEQRVEANMAMAELKMAEWAR
jgi:glycosyltransferase involved in cell wall biosynthesis